MDTPLGMRRSRVKLGSLEYSFRQLSLGEISTSMACCNRSERLTAALRKAAMESEALRRRTLSRPAVKEGAATAAMSAMMQTTTSISMRVTPRCEDLPPVMPLITLPAHDVGIDAVAPRLAVGAETDDVGVVAVLAGVFVDVVVAPRILGQVLLNVGTGPGRQIARLFTQRAQTLIVGGEKAGIQLVRGERR